METEKTKNVRTACKISLKIITGVEKKLACGMTEKDIKKEVLAGMRKYKVKPCFPAIVAFNSDEIHHKSSDKKITGKGFLILDVGVKYRGYCSDITRTIFIGRMSASEKNIYKLIANAQQALFSSIKPGMTAGALQKTVSDYFVKNKFKVLHAFGHCVGRRVHDKPKFRKNTVIEEGMIIAVEPGLYGKIKGKQFGCRIEDVVLVTKHGCKLLS
ncbi:MAG: M24 family metallopeptidase [Candidatus Aenigmatarchaeota archaeon]